MSWSPFQQIITLHARCVVTAAGASPRDDAVRSVGDRFGYGAHDETLMRLAAAAHTSHPDWVIRLAMGQAASIIDANTAGHYELAVQWLEKAALAYEVLGRRPAWTI